MANSKNEVTMTLSKKELCLIAIGIAKAKDYYKKILCEESDEEKEEKYISIIQLATELYNKVEALND